MNSSSSSPLPASRTTGPSDPSSPPSPSPSPYSPIFSGIISFDPSQSLPQTGLGGILGTLALRLNKNPKNPGFWILSPHQKEWFAEAIACRLLHDPEDARPEVSRLPVAHVLVSRVYNKCRPAEQGVAARKCPNLRKQVRGAALGASRRRCM
jgi:hypothetical protein